MMSAVFYVFLIFISINLDECVFDSYLKEITIGNMTKVITIPGHPRPFYSNRTLHWQITTESKNKVVSLRTDPLLNTNSTNCFLIYDGIVRTYRVISSWCLGTKESYVTRGRVMHLILQSNGTIPPFKLFLSERNKVECNNAGFIGTTRLAQYITSPFYPGHYPM
ncbi:hypothetical protein SNE40_004207 [Patella caerulea]|uniref:Uncharacterized protein n=1 Tax=Patella caerulea TaxID=87958 RepID=A0AAN8KFN2_PATCE